MTLKIMRVMYSNDLYKRFADRGAFDDNSATISSNLAYILALEYGHSKQAPLGMIRKYRNEYRAIVYEELQEALYATRYDYDAAARAGITQAALRVLVKIVERTPVDTGRAKGSWIVTLPGGKTQAGGKSVTEEQQKTKAKANRAKRARQANKDRNKAIRDARAESRSMKRAKRASFVDEQLSLFDAARAPRPKTKAEVRRANRRKGRL